MYRDLKLRGVTLLEMMLVLSIISFFLVLGLRQYQAYQLQQQLQQVRANVSLIFQGLARYYQAQCQKGQNYYNGTIGGTGALDAAQGNASPLAINIGTQLVAGNYLTQSLAQTSIVDTTAGYNGYYAQFNLATTSARSVTTTSGTTMEGTVYFWQAQVAVKVRDATAVLAYYNQLEANCMSSLNGSIITPCAADGSAGEGNYLVWQRLPSFAMLDAISDVWPTISVLKDFNNVYRHDEFYEINNPIAVTPNAPYYLCGG